MGISDVEQIEKELNEAFEAFTKAKHGEIFRGGSIRTTQTGSTFWDFVQRNCHRELEDMIAYLERNKKKMSPRDLVEYHLRIVTYFDRIRYLKTPGTQAFNSIELNAILTLYQRRGEQARLERLQQDKKQEQQALQEARTKASRLFDILHHHLYTDKESIVNPGERDKLIDTSDVKLAAYSLFLKYTGQDQSGSREADTELPFQQLLPVNYNVSNVPVLKKSLDTIPLKQKIIAYVTCTLFMDYFDDKIAKVKNDLISILANLSSIRLNPSEEYKLQLFEQGEDKIYSPANYFAAYTNAVWATVKDFLLIFTKKESR